MLIDWFTVGAQALNFLILVWLLKHFLYKPILNAIDAREKLIAGKLADADAKETEAQKERDEFQKKNDELAQQRAALLTKATDEAKAERQRLLDEARQAADVLSAKRQESLMNDARNLNQAVSRLTQKEVFAITRKALMDLATTTLEERMGDVFTRRLRELDDKSKAVLGDALKKNAEPALVRSTFDLPAKQRAAIQKCAQRNFFGRNSPSIRNLARSDQRDRALREWTKSRLEHRGLPRFSGKGCRRTSEGKGKTRGQSHGKTRR